MSCKLCRKDRPLRKSHVIPEFVYDALYDEKHRFHVASTESLPRKAKEQKGIRENLFCDDCEQRFSWYEDYARRLLQGGTEFKVTRERGLNVISGVNYRRFKLFQLSILWRAGIAAHALFKHVSLGPHEECLRQMLLANDPGKPLDYPCVMFGLRSDKGVMVDLIDQPVRIRLHGQRGHRFVFSGFVWAFLTGECKLPSALRAAVLNEEGKLMFLIKRFEELEHLWTFANDLHKMGRMPNPTGD